MDFTPSDAAKRLIESFAFANPATRHKPFPFRWLTAAAPKEDLALWILQEEVNRNEGSVFNYLGEHLGVEFKGVRHSP